MYFEIQKNLIFSTAVIQHIDFEVRYTVSDAVKFYFSFRYAFACDRCACDWCARYRHSNIQMKCRYYPRDEFT